MKENKQNVLLYQDIIYLSITVLTNTNYILTASYKTNNISNMNTYHSPV